MFCFFHIPVKLILRQVHTWSDIHTPFDIKIVFRSKVYSILHSVSAMTMFGFFHIPVKLIFRQIHPWSLIPTTFDIKIAFQHKVYSILQSALATGWSFLMVPSLSFIKGCHSINKQFSKILFYAGKVITCFSHALSFQLTHSLQTTAPQSLKKFKLKLT